MFVYIDCVNFKQRVYFCYMYYNCMNLWYKEYLPQRYTVHLHIYHQRENLSCCLYDALIQKGLFLQI